MRFKKPDYRVWVAVVWLAIAFGLAMRGGVADAGELEPHDSYTSIMMPTISKHAKERSGPHEWNERNFGIGFEFVDDYGDYRETQYLLTYNNSYAEWATAWGTGTQYRLTDDLHVGYVYGLVYGYDTCNHTICPWGAVNTSYAVNDDFGVNIWHIPLTVTGLSFTVRFD